MLFHCINGCTNVPVSTLVNVSVGNKESPYIRACTLIIRLVIRIAASCDDPHLAWCGVYLGPLHSRYICRGANWARARPLSHQALRQAVRRSAASAIRRGFTEPGSTARLQVRVAACSLMWRYSESSCESTVTPTAHHSVLFHFVFWALSQNCEKRILPSSCLSVRPSICPHGTTRLPLVGFA
jgi:hypothetical protein